MCSLMMSSFSRDFKKKEKRLIEASAMFRSTYMRTIYTVELKQISEISGYPFQIHYPDTGFELFRIVANYFKQL